MSPKVLGHRMYICLEHESLIAPQLHFKCGDILSPVPRPFHTYLQLSMDGVALDTIFVVPKDTSLIALTRIIGSFRIDREYLPLYRGYLQANYTLVIARKSQRGLDTLAMA